MGSYWEESLACEGCEALTILSLLQKNLLEEGEKLLVVSMRGNLKDSNGLSAEPKCQMRLKVSTGTRDLSVKHH